MVSPSLPCYCILAPTPYGEVTARDDTRCRRLRNRKTNSMFFKQLILTLFTLLAATAAAYAQNAPTKVGNATYYGDKWHGRRAADGSIFHQDSLTCAHKTLPFGTILHVRNPKNGKEVVVRVTDRGPYRKNTVIDLSKAAAKEIDMIQAGVAQVEITNMGIVPRNNASQTASEGEATLPELQLLDPVTGRYLTMTEWQQRANNRREMSKTNAAKQSENFVAKQQPRYRILNVQTANAKKN